MKPIKQMYQILEQMVKSADKGDTKKVRELNDSFEVLIPKVYHNPPTQYELDLDNCRQSCVLGLSDAKERFSKIPEP